MVCQCHGTLSAQLSAGSLLWLSDNFDTQNLAVEGASGWSLLCFTLSQPSLVRFSYSACRTVTVTIGCLCSCIMAYASALLLRLAIMLWQQAILHQLLLILDVLWLWPVTACRPGVLQHWHQQNGQCIQCWVYKAYIAFFANGAVCFCWDP